MNTNIAHKVAAIFKHDGECWSLEDGRELETVCEDYGADIQFGARTERGVVRCCSAERMADDPIRYVFVDGSAIVASGAAWDIEGDEPFSWAM